MIVGEEKGANILTPRIIMLRERRRKPTLFPFDAHVKGIFIRFALIFNPRFKTIPIDGATNYSSTVNAVLDPSFEKTSGAKPISF